MSRLPFDIALEMGHRGEEFVREILRHNGAELFHKGGGGCHVLNPGLKQPGQSGSVITFGPNGKRGIVMPDFYCFQDGRQWWVECKTKSKVGYFAKTGEYRNCVDAQEWRRKAAFQETNKTPVAFVFYEQNTGIVRGASINRLVQHLAHGASGHEYYYGGKRQVFFPIDCMTVLFNLYDQIQLYMPLYQ